MTKLSKINDINELNSLRQMVDTLCDQAERTLITQYGGLAPMSNINTNSPQYKEQQDKLNALRKKRNAIYSRIEDFLNNNIEF